MKWSIVNIGKYAGKNKILPQIVFIDPDYFFWAYEEGLFNDKLKHEAEELYKKVTGIKVPLRYGTKHIIEYTISSSNREFLCLELIEIYKPKSTENNITFRLPYFDMSVPRRLARYDETSYKIFTEWLKYYLFGNSKAKITKKLVEEFFDYPQSFL